MREAARWIIRSAIVTGILGFALFVVFLVLHFRGSPDRMSGAEILVGFPMVILWMYFWPALIVGVILHLWSRARDRSGQREEDGHATG